MLKKIKQLLCNHEWTDAKCINFSGYRIEFSYCKKCGKTDIKAVKL